MNETNIHYMAAPEHLAHFFPEELRSANTNIAQFLNGKGEIFVFPDAVIKKNHLPNGLALVMPHTETLLMPFLLRDPGCGYLTFKVDIPKGQRKSLAQIIGSRLNVLLNEDILSGKSQKQFFRQTPLLEVLLNGLRSIKDFEDDEGCFLDMDFAVDATVIDLSEEEEATLHLDFMALTNTVELREVISAHAKRKNSTDIKENDFIGFIHCGCVQFPTLLSRRFTLDICKFADNNHISTLEQIRHGILGVPLSSNLGYIYSQWLKTAMNYALVSRYLIYKQIKQCLKAEFNIEIMLMNDVTHAGFFEQMQHEQPYTISTRGVQPLFSLAKKNKSSHFRLIAGQKESIAILAQPVSTTASHDNWIQHGTSYQVPEENQVQDFFDSHTAEHYLQAANNAYYNTITNLNLTLPYSFNTLVSQKHQENIGIIKPLAVLAPFINIHSGILINEQGLEIQ